MMITSLLLPPSALLLEAAAAKSLCKGPDAPAARTSARVRFAAGEATTSVAARVTAAAAAAPPFASCSVDWAKNDLMDGTAAAAAAESDLPRRRGREPSAAAAAACSWRAVCAKMDVVAAVAGADAARRFAAAGWPPAARLREPCRSNTLADSCFVVAWPFTLANSDLAAESAKRLEAGISVDHLACR